jgi:hypothetical protein
MPHVSIEGPIQIEEIESKFEPILYREGTRIIKIERFFREKSGRSALLETVAVEAGHKQKFFIQLSAKEGSVTVRPEPLTDPEKSSVVRIALALVARRILDWSSDCRSGNTNISEYLLR